MPIAAVDQLIPHRPPMQLLDQVLAYDTTRLWAHTRARMPSAGQDVHRIRACFGLEYLAQAAAAFFTLQASRGEAPRQGMLVACRRFSTEHAYYAVSSSLLIGVELTSPLPAAARSPTLVKFQGEIHLLQSAADLPRSVAACQRAAAGSATTVADLSVYL